MAILPLNHRITVYSAVLDDDGVPVTDEWDRPVFGEPIVLKCRATEGTKLTRSQTSQGGVSGVVAQEVVSSVQFLIDKLAPIRMGDRIEFTDELGRTRTFTPIAIEPKRGLNGKAMLTEVLV